MAHYLRRITDEVSTGLTAEQVQMEFVGKLRSVLVKPDVDTPGSVPLPPEAVLVEVSDNAENPDYYDVVMRIQPPFQILGRDVSLLLGIQLHR
jgi:predicted component of type VI protein secretion system